MIFDDVSKILPRYDLIEIIGTGGMGIVYRAWDKKVKREVAVKIIRESDIVNEKIQRRFLQEAKIITNLEHPNIVKLYDFGKKGDVLYYSMSYIKGIPVDRYVFNNNLSIKKIIQLTIKVCQILDYIHANGIIHRDIKPSNILIDDSGTPHILDFGIAKDYSYQQGLTQTGELIGTVRYISPEQIENKNINQQSDVYSVSVLLYYLLSKEFPHDGNISVNLMMKVLTEEPVPLKKRGSFPEMLNQVCMAGLEKNRAYRTQSAHFLAENLQMFIQNKYRSKVIIRKKQLVFAFIAAAFLFLIWKNIFFYEHETNIIIDPIVEIENLIQLTLYEDANDKIINLIQNNKKEPKYKEAQLKKLQMSIWKGLHQYQNIISYPEAYDEDSELAFLRATAHYFANSSAQVILSYLDKVSDNNSLAEEVLFYQISTFYKFRDFAKMKKIDVGKIDTFDNERQKDMAYLYLIDMYLQDYSNSSDSKLYKQIYVLLLKVNDNTGNILFFENWAKYLSLPGDYQNIVESSNNWLRCCELRPYESMYWTQLGQAQLKLQKTYDAYNSFYKAITVAKDSSYIDALEELIKFSLHDPKWNEEIFWLIMNVFLKKENSTEPDILEEEIKNIRQIHEPTYNTFRKAKRISDDREKQIKTAHTFFNILAKEDITNKTSAIDGLRLISYSLDMNIVIDEYLNNITNKQQQQNFKYYRNILLEDIRKQHQNLQYYRLANQYLFNDNHTKQELLENIDYLYKMIYSKTETLLMRYLAAKALISMNHYEFLLEILEKESNHPDSICIVAALQEAQIPVKIQYWLEYNVFSAERYHSLLFMRSLPLRSKVNALLFKEIKDSDERSFTLEKLLSKLIPFLKESDPKIKVCAAAMIWRFMDMKELICLESRNILREMLDYKSHNIRQYAHFHYWKSSNFAKYKNKEDTSLYIEVFQKQETTIQMMALDLHHPDLLGKFVEPLLLELIKEKDKEVALKATLLLTKINPSNKVFREWMYTNKLSLGVRAIAVASSGSLSIKSYNNVALSSLENSLRYTDFVFSEDIYEDEYKAFIYNLFSLLGVHYRKALLDNISPSLKANIISGFHMENVVPKKMRHFLLFFPNKVSKKEQIEYIQKCNEDTTNTPVLQETIYSSLFLLSNDTEKKELYLKAKSSGDKIFRNAVSWGFYRLIHQDLTGDIEAYKREMGVSPFYYHFYLYYLEELCADSRKREKYLGWINKAIELSSDSKEKVQYYFERAILHRLSEHYQEALSDIEQAFSIKNENKLRSLYTLEAAHILYLNNPNEQAQVEYSNMLKEHLPFVENLYEVIQMENFCRDLNNENLQVDILYRKLYLCLSLQVVDDNSEFLLDHSVSPQTTWHYEVAEQIYRSLALACKKPSIQNLHKNSCNILLQIKK